MTKTFLGVNLGVGALAASLLLGSAASVHASLVTLANWAPVPNAVGFPEINYTAAGLQTGPGAIGNGDGNVPVTAQTPGGLQVDTPETAPVPFSFPSSLFTGGTGYYDVSLVFTGLAPVGPAVQTPLGGGINQDTQVLGPGTFALISTAPAGSVPILTGNITGATIVTGIDGGNAGATFNANGITYTGGAIVAALPPSALLSGNDMSISLTAIAPNFSINPASGQLAPFNADATGEFDISSVPEPATLSLLFVGAGALAFRRKRS